MRPAFLAASLALLATAHALDLTPLVADVDADGLRIRQPYFQDGLKRVFIAPPDGWKLEGDSARAILSSDAAPGCTVVFTLSAKPLLATADADPKVMREAVLALAPPGSARVTLDGEVPDPLPLNGWKTHQLRIAYDIDGARTITTVVLVRLNAREELQVIATAPEADIERTAATAFTCLRTWHKR